MITELKIHYVLQFVYHQLIDDFVIRSLITCVHIQTILAMTKSECDN